jgi:hypothetical protein
MSADLVKWPRDALEIERIEEEAGIPDLAPSAATYESPKLLVGAATTPRRHLLKRPKPMEVTVGSQRPPSRIRSVGEPSCSRKGSDAVRASEPDNLDARRRKVEAASLSQRFDRDLVAYTLNDHHRVHVGPVRSHPLLSPYERSMSEGLSEVGGTCQCANHTLFAAEQLEVV